MFSLFFETLIIVNRSSISEFIQGNKEPIIVPNALSKMWSLLDVNLKQQVTVLLLLRSHNLLCFRFILKLIRSSGHRHAINLSRINPYSKDLHFTVHSSTSAYTTRILQVGDEPALCYTIAFARNPNTLQPHPLPFGDAVIKQAFMVPFIYEYERIFPALSVIAGLPRLDFKCYGPGMKVGTRSRSADWTREY